jgi:hypothetical protein
VALQQVKSKRQHDTTDDLNTQRTTVRKEREAVESLKPSALQANFDKKKSVAVIRFAIFLRVRK